MRRAAASAVVALAPLAGCASVFDTLPGENVRRVAAFERVLVNTCLPFVVDGVPERQAAKASRLSRMFEPPAIFTSPQPGHGYDSPGLGIGAVRLGGKDEHGRACFITVRANHAMLAQVVDRAVAARPRDFVRPPHPSLERVVYCEAPGGRAMLSLTDAAGAAHYGETDLSLVTRYDGSPPCANSPALI